MNFAKDQSDDYVSKDASVRRKDTVAINIAAIGSAHAATEGGGGQRESVM